MGRPVKDPPTDTNTRGDQEVWAQLVQVHTYGIRERKRLMNQERPDEAIAKQIVERVVGIRLEHADTHGGVDYISTDGTFAFEVTAVTDEQRKSARDALSKPAAKNSPGTGLQGCWMVILPDTQPGMKTFRKRVQSAIADLEFAGEAYFTRHRAKVHVDQGGGLSHIYQPLLDAGVERAVPYPCRLQEGPDHVHRLKLSPGSGGSVSGSNESLDRLMEELSKKTDNPTKLRASDAEQRHLFVWLNDDTSENIARPLSRDPPSRGGEGWGLPTTKPQLDPAITHLWVMHDRTRLGWLWDGETWQALCDP